MPVSSALRTVCDPTEKYVPFPIRPISSQKCALGSTRSSCTSARSVYPEAFMTSWLKQLHEFSVLRNVTSTRSPLLIYIPVDLNSTSLEEIVKSCSSYFRSDSELITKAPIQNPI